jgi:uncharacterized membrane protein
VVGTGRTFGQDPQCAIRLPVDIAIRARTPTVDDPTTAVRAPHQTEDTLRRPRPAAPSRAAGRSTPHPAPVPPWLDASRRGRQDGAVSALPDFDHVSRRSPRATTPRGARPAGGR